MRARCFYARCSYADDCACPRVYTCAGPRASGRSGCRANFIGEGSSAFAPPSAGRPRRLRPRRRGFCAHGDRRGEDVTGRQNRKRRLSSSTRRPRLPCPCRELAVPVPGVRGDRGGAGGGHRGVRPGCFFVPRTVAFTASVRHRACIPRPVPLCGCTTRPHGVRHRQHRQQQR
ncbi:unnamed protein product [Lampetra fluviatilis]